jgi:hypothetical protein
MSSKGLRRLLRLLGNAKETLILVVCYQCLYLLLYIVKQIAIRLTLIAKTTKVYTELMKIVPFFTRFELNEAIGNTNGKVDTKLIELV